MARKRNIPAACVLGLPALAAGVLLLGGCQRSLFSDNADRTPFDRYDRIQNQYAVPFVYDEYGTRVPNLRARLLPRD